MSTEKTYLISCGSIEATAELASKLARNIRAGDVIELTSDLGGGKTTFVKHIVAALGSVDDASSPSFTIENIYKTKDFYIHHFDFYRLEEAGIMGDELNEVLDQEDSVVFIEWAGLVSDLLPKDRLSVNIEVDKNESRVFEFKTLGDTVHLVKGIL